LRVELVLHIRVAILAGTKMNRGCDQALLSQINPCERVSGSFSKRAKCIAPSSSITFNGVHRIDCSLLLLQAHHTPLIHGQMFRFHHQIPHLSHIIRTTDKMGETCVETIFSFHSLLRTFFLLYLALILPNDYTFFLKPDSACPSFPVRMINIDFAPNDSSIVK
jgi:hypothetical protein